MLRRFSFRALLLTALCACNTSVAGGEGGSGTTTATSTTATTTTATTTGGTGGAGGSAPLACASAPLCAGIYLPSDCDAFGTSGSGGGAPSPQAVTEMRCALLKLRDHEVGYVSLFLEAHTNTGCGVRTEIVSFGDGSASVQHIQWADLGVGPGTPERVQRESVGYFDACLAGTDDNLAACVQAMTTKALAAGPTCPCRGVPGAQDGQCTSPF